MDRVLHEMEEKDVTEISAEQDARFASKFPDWLIAFGDSGYAVLYQVDGEQSIVLADRH